MAKLMPNTDPIPPHMRAVEAAQGAHRRSASRFSVSFCAAILTVFCLALWIASRPSFIAQTDSMAGYGHRAKGIACDVLIDGDSTAAYDLNPFVIEKMTGLKSCNIAEARPVEDFVGPYFPIDDYLGHNPPPRFLVTTWALTDFQLDRQPNFTTNADGFDYAIRFDRGWWLWKGMLLHPGDTVNMVCFEVRAVLGAIHAAFSLGDSSAKGIRAIRDSQQGWLDGGRGAGQKACMGFPKFDIPSTLQLNESGVVAFRRRYEALGIKVIVDVSPAADCTANLRQNLALIRGLHDNRFEALPVDNFVSGDVHLLGDSATRYSEEVADQILALMKKDAEAKR